VTLGHSISGNAGGPLVVLLHGFLGSRRDWSDVVDSLGATFRCLTIDLPGHGESLGGVEAEYTIPSAATAVIDLIDHFDAASFSLVGYSMGGRLALYLSSIYAMRIDALVIESASPGLITAEERRARREHDERWVGLLESGDVDAFLDAWYGQPLFKSIAARPDLLESLCRERSKQDIRELARALRGLGVANQLPLWDEWRANHIPTLLIAGALDEKYCAIARQMAAECASAEVAIVSNAGHNVHVEASSAYNSAIVSFLNRTLNPKSQH